VLSVSNGSPPFHEWIPATPRPRPPAHFLPQEAHSIYRERILSVRAHSIYGEHILSTENTENTFYLNRLAALPRISPCENTRTKTICACREQYPPPPPAAKPAPAAAKVVEAKVTEICFRCPEIFSSPFSQSS
jgi:hypothetical protein